MHLYLPLLLAGVAAAAVSPDWTCGGVKKYTCPNGTCCSKYGWCGTTSAYCAAGCQSAFGKCTAASHTTLKTSTTTAKTSTSSKPTTASKKTTSSTTSTSQRTTSASSTKTSTSTSSKPSTTSKATTTSTATTAATSTKASTSTTSAKTTSSATSTTSKVSSTSSTVSSSTSATALSSSSTTPASTKSSSSISSSTSSTLSTSSTPGSTTSSTSSASSSTASATGTPTPNSGKRGLAFNDASLTQPFSRSGQDSKVSWAWNWFSSPYPGAPGSGSTFNPALKFVPMLWSDAWSLVSVWEDNIAYAAAHLGADSLMAFNQPDDCSGQACMVVPQAVHAYKEYLQPHAGSFALGAPAVSNSAAPGEGLEWLAAFMGNCTGCTVDFIPLHYKGDAGSADQLKTFVQTAHAQFPAAPLWLTEYAVTGGAAPADVLAFLREVVPWLDAQGYVQRHSFFMDTTGDAFLMNADGSGLNDIGKYYNSGS